MPITHSIKEVLLLAIKQENKILIAVMIGSFLTPFCGSSINLSLPDIGREFIVGTSALSWIIEIFLMTCAICVLPMGQLSNRIGKRTVYLMGTGGFAVVSFLIHFTNSIEMLLGLRILQGVCAAMIFATGTAIVAQAYPVEKRGRAMGLVASIVYIGLAIGPVVGGFLNFHFGWRSVFYFIAILGAFAFLCTMLWMKENWKLTSEGHLNTGSILLYSSTLILVMYGLSEIVNQWWAKYMLFVGIVAGVIYVWHEARVEKPLIPVRIFLENKTFAFSNLAAMLNYSATFAIGFLLSLYLQMIMGFDSATAGLVLLTQSIIMSVLSPVTGALSDRYGSAILASIGMAVIACGLLVILYGTHEESLMIIIVSLIIIGIGFAMFSAPNNNAIMSSVPPKYFSFASSVIGTVRLFGQVFSMAVVASILSRAVDGAVPGSAELLLSNIQYAFVVFTVFCVVGVIPSMIRNR